MKRYEVTIEETLTRTVTVDVPDSFDQHDAYDVVWEKYNDGDIVLTAEDFCDSHLSTRLAEQTQGEPDYVMDEQRNVKE